MSVKQLRRNYKRFRADNHYSYPALFFFLDILVSLSKILALGLALGLVWFVVSRFVSQNPETPLVSVTPPPQVLPEVEKIIASSAESEVRGIQLPEPEPEPEPEVLDVAPLPAPVIASAEKLARLELMDQNWTLKQDDGFTVQLGSSLEKSKLVDFAAEVNLNEQLHLYPFKISRLGNPIYGLAFGVYPDFETAEKVVGELPAALKEYKPWIRPVGILQNQIKMTLNKLDGRQR